MRNCSRETKMAPTWAPCTPRWLKELGKACMGKRSLGGTMSALVTPQGEQGAAGKAHREADFGEHINGAPRRLQTRNPCHRV